MVEYGDLYRYNQASIEAVNQAGVAWMDVLHVLYTAQPKIRRHIGGVLRVVAPAPDGAWILVALIEQEDDVYLVVSARYLEDTEVEAARRMIGGDLHEGES